MEVSPTNSYLMKILTISHPVFVNFTGFTSVPVLFVQSLMRRDLTGLNHTFVRPMRRDGDQCNPGPELTHVNTQTEGRPARNAKPFWLSGFS